MKKLIVLSVIFALAVGNVFAADVSAAVNGGANLLSGSNAQVNGVDKDGKTVERTEENGTSFGISRVRFGASGQLEDGTIGGWARIEAGNYGGGVNGWGFVWWKPSDLIKLQIGANPDGEFGLDGITRWGFYQLAGDAGVVKPDNAWGSASWAWTGLDANFGNAFYGGWGSSGVILNITPVDALAINLGIPLGSIAYRDYKKTTIQVKYNIDGVGTAGLTYLGDLAEDEPVFSVAAGSTAKDPWDVKGLSNDSPKVIAYFGLSSIENVGIDIGIGYKFSDTYTDEKTSPVTGSTDTTTTKKTSTVSEPLAVGVGVSFNSGPFGLKTRVLGQFMGSLTYDYEETGTNASFKKVSWSETLSTGYAVLFDIQPSYAINDKLTLYVSAGIGIAGGVEDLYYELDSSGNPKLDSNNKATLFEKKTQDSLTAWHFEPYISLTPSYWSATFFAGIRLESPSSKDIKDKTYVKWSIPIGITCSF